MLKYLPLPGEVYHHTFLKTFVGIPANTQYSTVGYLVPGFRQ
jgi:hypothetical protein